MDGAAADTYPSPLGQVGRSTDAIAGPRDPGIRFPSLGPRLDRDRPIRSPLTKSPGLAGAPLMPNDGNSVRQLDPRPRQRNAQRRAVALVAIVSFADFVAAACGVNVTEIAQEAPGSRFAGQSLVCGNHDATLPVRLIL